MKILLIIVFTAISVNSYSQNIVNSDSIYNKYNRKIQGLQQKRLDEIKTLTSNNYLANKSRINNKYNAFIDSLITQRDLEITQVRQQKEKAEQINQKEELAKQELEKKKKAQEEELQKIESEKEKTEMKKKEAEEYEERQVQIAKKKQELNAIRESYEKQKEFERSDYGKIQMSTKTEFLAWREKTEFESQEEYMKRVKNYLEKFNEIFNSEINKSKAAKLRIRLFRVPLENLSAYDVEHETYLLSTNENTFSFKVPKSIAKDFKDNLSEIAILPKDFIMINNNWVCSKAFVIMNNRLSYGVYLNDLISIQELTNGTLLFRYADSQYDKYKLKDITKCDHYQDGLYYYSWDITQENSPKTISSQNLKLSLEELKIEIPLKN